MNLFYNPNITETPSELVFDKEESRHIIKVLRKQTGDALHLTNGKGSIFEATLISTDPKRCVAHVHAEEKQSPLPYHLHLAVAPTKLNDRYEWFLEKATEIGVSEITPILCEHSERKVVKLERYQKILVSAMKQSMNTYLPKLNEPVSFRDFVANAPETTTKCIAHCEEDSKQRFKNVVAPRTSVLVLIGPEGDFSKSEIAKSIQHNFTPITLGDSRLRTETAGLVATNMVSYINQ